MIEKIYLDSPHPFDTYLERLTNIIIIFFDHQQKILEFNHGFKKAVNISEEKLYNQSLGNIFTVDSMELINFSADQNYNKTNLELNQNVTIKQVDREFICHIFQLENCYCLIGEDTGSEDEEVLNKISKLNNELSSITRELSKKNMKLERANQRIKELSRKDSLTDLYNRRAFIEYFEKQLAQSQRHSHSLSLIITDIDDFKEINDTYGHSAGDDVL
ncbi:MAG: diguanylate cyclase, partial [Bacillota bacterium]